MAGVILTDDRVISIGVWVIVGLITIMGKIYISIQKKRAQKINEISASSSETKSEIAQMSNKLEMFIEEVVSLKKDVKEITGDIHNIKSDIKIIKHELKL